ncbi:MAG: DUF3078 domain-containing protein [Bacteroidales bacterium]|nr:DUF3078 domain-containing protein [Bacteroidales bacterium]
MKRLLLVAGIFLMSVCVAKAQDEPTIEEAAAAAKAASSVEVKKNAEVPDSLNWKFSGIVGANMTQTQLVNWAAGGNSNLTGIIFANLFLNYKKGNIAWDSNLDTELGAMFSSDFNRYPWRKASDKFNFYTKFGWEFHKTWFLAILGSFRTQYMYDYDYEPVKADPHNDRILSSRCLNPSYTDLSVGIDWKPNDIFSVYLSPLAGRLTTATYKPLREKYGVDTNKTFKMEVGLTFKAAVTYDKIKNLKIFSAITLFTPYTKKFGNFNVDWDFMISYQFLKVLNVSLTTALRYYDEVMIPGKVSKHGYTECARVQFKEVLGLGIGYSF